MTNIEITTDEVEHKSSTVAKSIYNHLDKSLNIEFKNGTIYKYKNVDEDAYESFIEGQSTGKALNEFIKGNFDYEKL